MVEEEHQTPVSEPEEITIWKNPIQTLSTLLLCCIEWAGQGWTIIRQRIIAITILLAIVLIPHLVLGPHTPVLAFLHSILKRLMILQSLLVGGSALEYSVLLDLVSNMNKHRYRTSHFCSLLGSSLSQVRYGYLQMQRCA